LVAGLIHHFRGELECAIALYERGVAGPGTDGEHARIQAWAAAAYWLRGDLEACRVLASEAAALADRAGDDVAAAAACTALAMVAALDGDRRTNELQYLRALRHAEAAGDAMQLVRIRTNRASRLLEEGYYTEAVAEAEAALQIGDMTGFGSYRALALSNRGQALLASGHLEAARHDLEAARDAYQRAGSRMVSYPLAHLGEVFRHEGQPSQAQACFEEALAVARSSGDVQGLVPALTGLALLAADCDPAAASALADEALAAGPALGRQRALVARGRAEMAANDVERARATADQAAAVARARRDRSGLAEALELSALAATSSARAARLLDEADRLWQELGNDLGAARVLLLRARTAAGDGRVRAELARAAEHALWAVGARALADDAAALRKQLEAGPRRPLAIAALGRFRVSRDGAAIGPTEWQSRKARHLLKILVARRGQPVARDALLEFLWPEDDSARSASKLSVTLSTLRAVLDPEKRFGPDHFVGGDRSATWLQLDHVAVDLEQFLHAADGGLAARRKGPPELSFDRLVAVEAAYDGDFCEDEPYEEWAIAVREEARSAYVSVTHALVELGAATGQFDMAVRYGLRLLARDPYHEPGHLAVVSALVAAGRHGDARRAYRLYSERIAEIDAEPIAFPTLERHPKPA
jgi:DNA-binding SARP family transcriptional activator